MNDLVLSVIKTQLTTSRPVLMTASLLLKYGASSLPVLSQLYLDKRCIEDKVQVQVELSTALTLLIKHNLIKVTFDRSDCRMLYSVDTRTALLRLGFSRMAHKYLSDLKLVIACELLVFGSLFKHEIAQVVTAHGQYTKTLVEKTC